MRFCSLSSCSTWGNAYLIEHGGSYVLIEYGTAARTLKEGFSACNVGPGHILGVFISHEHSDHCRTLRLQFHKKFGIERFYASRGTWANLDNHFPRHVIEDRTSVGVGPFTVSCFRKSHDAAEPVGFVVEAGGEKIAVVTDLGCITTEVVKAARDVDYMILESNHDPKMQLESGRPWYVIQRVLGDSGHLSNDQAAEFFAHIASERLRSVLLAHLSLDCNTPELALRTFTRRAEHIGYEGTIGVAPACGPSKWYGNVGNSRGCAD
ncbi:MAG: MBL fold metallo-hydrolase [Bacillota bacterium]